MYSNSAGVARSGAKLAGRRFGRPEHGLQQYKSHGGGAGSTGAVPRAVLFSSASAQALCLRCSAKRLARHCPLQPKNTGLD